MCTWLILHPGRCCPSTLPLHSSQHLQGTRVLGGFNHSNCFHLSGQECGCSLRPSAPVLPTAAWQLVGFYLKASSLICQQLTFPVSSESSPVWWLQICRFLTSPLRDTEVPSSREPGERPNSFSSLGFRDEFKCFHQAACNTVSCFKVLNGCTKSLACVPCGSLGCVAGLVQEP